MNERLKRFIEVARALGLTTEPHKSPTLNTLQKSYQQELDNSTKRMLYVFEFAVSNWDVSPHWEKDRATRTKKWYKGKGLIKHTYRFAFHYDHRRSATMKLCQIINKRKLYGKATLVARVENREDYKGNCEYLGTFTAWN